MKNASQPDRRRKTTANNSQNNSASRHESGLKKKDFPVSEDATRKLIHELQVHLLELEARNAELRDARDAGDTLLGENTCLHEDEHNLRVLMDLIPVGVGWSDNVGNIEYLNRRFVKQFGYAITDTPTVQEWFLCAFPDPVYRGTITGEWNAKIVESRTTGLPASPMETNITCKDGAVRNVIINIQRSRNRTLAIFTDITEHEFTQSELLKARKLESLGILAGGIAHDFNNILTIIMGNVSFAQKLLEPSHRSLQLLQEAEKASHRASELAYQLLTFAKGCKPIKKTVSVHHIVNESVSLSLRGSNVQGIIEVPVSIHAIEADEGQLSQAFNNVIINAVQAMPNGGSVIVCAGNTFMDDRNKLGLQPGKYVKITFTDNGSGIPDEDLKKLFDPYFTTKTGGSGLGLTSTWSIINNHGGHICVNSSVGKGTTFTIYLPSTGEAFLKHGADNENITVCHSPDQHVLVMEDEEMIRYLALQMLEYLGYRVTACACGEEAVALYKVASESGKPFYAVLMDMTIPGGMGGKEAAQHILAIDPAARLILSSGYSNDPIMANHRDYGFCCSIAKPYKLAEIAKALNIVQMHPGTIV